MKKREEDKTYNEQQKEIGEDLSWMLWFVLFIFIIGIGCLILID